MILKDYLKYTEKSACPENYNIWVFLSMASAVLRKNIKVQLAYYTLYPNLYVILASPPGIGRKSSAMDLGKALVDASGVDVNFAIGARTPRSLIDELETSYSIARTSTGRMSCQSSMTLICDELVNLLGTAGVQMVDVLTELFSSSNYEYKTATQGNVHVKNHCLNLLAGITTQNLGSRLMQEAAAGGLLSRAILVYSNTMKFSPSVQTISDEAAEAKIRCVERLKELPKLYGALTLDSEATELFTDFERAQTRKLNSQVTDGEFTSRVNVQVLKVAMILAALDMRMEITGFDIQVAIKLLADVEQGMKHITMATGESKTASLLQKLTTAIAMSGELTKADITQLFMHNANMKDIDESLTTLKRVGFICMEKNNNNEVVMRITPKGQQSVNVGNS